MTSSAKRALWFRWVLANGLGEMLGLGLTFAVGISLMAQLGSDETARTVILAFGIAVGSGVLEATIVGLAQWWVMHPWFPGISRRSWWLSTLAGALLAYIMGYLPSTLISLGEQSGTSQSPATEPAQWIILLLATGLGLVGGAVLSFAQYLTMRKTVPHSSTWVPANMLAWMVGMPLIFLGIDLTQRLQGLFWQVAFMAFVLLLAGLVVGAIHGAFLVRLAHPPGLTEKTPLTAG